jgi:FlaA1/EpsC-like NDP-sugar epimerase
VRLGFRALWESERDGQEQGRRAIVVDAGDARELLVRKIERNPGLDYDVVGYVDDDRDKEANASTGRESWGASSNCHTGISLSMT